AGKGAIVTGARDNMGRAFAVALARMGANVVVHHHTPSSLSAARETAKLVEAEGVKAVIVDGDLGDVANVKRLYDAAQSNFGSIDVVVNNAGYIVKKPFAELTDEDFELSVAVNTRGLFYSMREAARRIANNGRIINIGTSLLAGAAPGYTAYAGTKAAVEEFTRILAKEIGERGVTVNVVAPGPVDTPFYHGQETPQSVAYAKSLSVAKRLGEVQDIVPLVEWLASPGSQWVTGQTLWINGGYLTR
ncbi:MAG TPA: SDR family oxidoreductase, partial [Albitalea sp.]|nr:SDR family oxidoreductase [Albitalea sp.]